MIEKGQKMKLRNFKNSDAEYNIGLDIGTGSVGWAVTDEGGDLCLFKGKHTWGSRLFPGAEQAAEARVHRGQRRRYIRRRWRLDLLQGFFQEAMEEVDPEFFIRLRQSRLLKEDRADGHRDYRYPLFNDADFTEVDYYDKFPTIYHLRAWLMETDEKADLRLIYLALHNIVKHRGNFLRQGETLSAKNANTKEAVRKLCEALEEWCQADELPCEASKNRAAICEVLEAKDMSKSERKDKIVSLLDLGKEGDRLDGKKLGKALASAIVGLKAEMAAIFVVEAEGTNLYLSNDEQVEAFEAVLPSEGEELFQAMRAVYASFVLGGILSHVQGATLSVNKIAEYEQYGRDLRTLKDLVQEYALDRYDDFFRGEFYRDADGNQTGIYDKSKASGYTRYDLGVRASSYDAFRKDVEKVLGGTGAEQDERYITMMEAFKEERFLRRLKTSDNGSIPYQLHLEEMQAILKNQGVHYPFLRDEADKIETLVTFRIPYYVGPLSLKNAPRTESKDLEETEAGAGRYRFAWATRKPGQEDAVIKPWNWDTIIDTHASAEAFIKRMVGMCTYIQGAEVLPKESLLYQEYCVLNELNGAHWSQDGDDEHRFEAYDTREIVDELFRKKRGKVSYKQVQEWLARERGAAHAHVSGGQGEAGFESRLSSYGFFCDVLGVDALSAAQYDMAENIILWNTLFEDRSILKEKVRAAYGDELSPEQIKKICKKRFTGWGRLSREFLCGVKVPTDDGMKSVMDVLREGHPNNGEKSRVVVLMEVIRDDKLAFEKKIDERNREYARERGFQLEDIPGSPALRRGINQAIRIVEEIVGIAGKPPANVFIEVTRGEDKRSPRGKRTNRRHERLKAALDAFKSASPELFGRELLKELKQKENELDDDRLMLYFMQGGKSLYSGKILEINELSTYEIDHIIPRSYIKDDSLDNKALVLREENQRKLDSLLLDDGIRRSQKAYWRALHDAKLISDKKFNNLMRSSISDKAMRGFINRQLVETSQIVKYVRLMLEERYADTKIVSIKAGITHGLREACDFVKCREINDYHHAHDAYLACQVGRFVQGRYPALVDEPVKMTKILRKYVQAQSAAFARTRKTPGSAGFIVDSFLKPNFDIKTGELYSDGIVWNADEEIARIRKSLDYKDCFISRMPEETRGAFWDANPVSFRGGKKTPGVPLKEGLGIEKYGGYSGIAFAYYVLFEARNSKGKIQRYLEGVPIRVARSIDIGETCIFDFVLNLAKERGASEYGQPRILRKKILKYARMNHGQDEYYIATGDALYSARQLHLSRDMQSIVARIEKCAKEKAVSTWEGMDEDLICLYDVLKEKGVTLCSRFNNVEKILENGRQLFISLVDIEKIRLIMGLLAFYRNQTSRVDLSSIGGSKNAGAITNGLISRPGEKLVFIDQSVTGMFERRTHIGL